MSDPSTSTGSPVGIGLPLPKGPPNITLDAFGIGIAIVSLLAYKKFVQPLLQQFKLNVSYSRADESAIEHAMSQLLAISRCDRVLLFELHHDRSGRQLISATKEVTSPGVTLISGDYQSVLLDSFAPLMSRLMTNSFIRSDIGQIENYQCQSGFVSIGVEYAITKLFLKDNKPVGLLQLHYCRSQRDDFDSFWLLNQDKLLSQIYVRLTDSSVGFIRALLNNLM